MAIPGTLGFLGFGNMGGAIAQGLTANGVILPDQILVFDVLEEKRAAARALGARLAASPAELAHGADTLLLAVKPQSMAEALGELQPAFQPTKTLVISIAAGISIAFIQDRLGADARVARVMPNTPALVNAGAAGIALSANASEADGAVARAVFEAVGVAVTVPESLIDAVTALSGSGPAYFFYTVECLVKAAVALGLSERDASLLAGQTLLGAGRLLMESGEPASALRERVTSKGGTTAAALEAFRARGLEDVLAAGVDAAAARAAELGK